MDDLFTSLRIMLDECDALLLETSLNDLQRRFVNNIFQGSLDLRDLFLTLPDVSHPRVREVMSFETRNNLSAIIGYAEVLLDEEDGELSVRQRHHVHAIRSAGKQLLQRVVDIARDYDASAG